MNEYVGSAVKYQLIVNIQIATRLHFSQVSLLVFAKNFKAQKSVIHFNNFYRWHYVKNRNKV